jgi:CRISPR-associated endonuclease/helicase Cas3
MEFDALFKRALGERAEPFPLQRSFAETLELPSTVRVPTDLGKTATVILGWIWRRFHAPSQIRASTPGRPVYCLPVRTLVEKICELSTLLVVSHAA